MNEVSSRATSESITHSKEGVGPDTQMPGQPDARTTGHPKKGKPAGISYVKNLKG